MKTKRHLLMYYPDLRSLDDVDALSMPEFNLRLHCLLERFRWERGVVDEEPTEEMKPVANPKQTLAEILLDIKQRQIAEEANAKR